ncbi:MAG TPA: hypothetical protein VHT73_12795, partial [Thermodesulfobacteriota bacterium]|nr:hypothetical protein [Thermodesulfobacteriota bacterium]
SLGISLEKLITLRANAILAALTAFEPDVLIVDNVPRGAVRELDSILKYLRLRGHTRCVLGMREILDEPVAVQCEWQYAANEDAIKGLIIRKPPQRWKHMTKE